MIFPKNAPYSEYLENEKSFLGGIKSIFHNYLRAVIKNKKLKLKIAGTSFKLSFNQSIV